MSRVPGEHLLKLSSPGDPRASETQFAPGGKHCRKSILGEGDLLENTETSEWLKATCSKGNKIRIWCGYQQQKARCHTTELHSQWIELLKGRAGKRADENFSEKTESLRKDYISKWSRKQYQVQSFGDSIVHISYINSMTGRCSKKKASFFVCWEKLRWGNIKLYKTYLCKKELEASMFVRNTAFCVFINLMLLPSVPHSSGF